MNPDPDVQDPSNAQNLNRYSYCLNNPLRYTDPSGCEPTDDGNPIPSGANWSDNSSLPTIDIAEVTITGKMPDQSTISLQLVSGSSLPSDPNSGVIGILSGVPLNNSGYCRIVDIDPNSVPGAGNGPTNSPQNNQTNASNFSSQSQPSSQPNPSGGITPAASTMIAKQNQPKKEYHVPQIETNGATIAWLKKLDAAFQCYDHYTIPGGTYVHGPEGGNNNNSTSTGNPDAFYMDPVMAALIARGDAGALESKNIIDVVSKIVDVVNAVKENKTNEVKITKRTQEEVMFDLSTKHGIDSTWIDGIDTFARQYRHDIIQNQKTLNIPTKQLLKEFYNSN
jgi:hypothetical protein